MNPPSLRFLHADLPAIRSRQGKSEFRLVRYFSVAGFAAFLAVAAVLYVLERRENDYFREVQQAQRSFIAKVQESFARQQETAARRDLLLVHEAGHVNLTRLLANAMWDTHVAPLVARAQRISTEQCHALSTTDPQKGIATASNAAPDCFAAIGKTIAALPEAEALDAKVGATIKSSTVFKVKVFDLRGITVYSSERSQIGEDKYNNQGWRMAAGGHPASEMTHRDRFSAFEGVVENRDLISTYVPVTHPGSEKVVGVFEIYSDVTPFLSQIKTTFANIAERSAANQADLDRIAADNQGKVEAASHMLIATVGVLLIFLYLALLLIVRNAQRILDTQAQAQERFIEREERWHREKMSALAAMAATVAHEIGNPLAVITGLTEAAASETKQETNAAMILEQVRRISAKTRQIADFAATHSESIEPVDVNLMVQAVCDFLTFDRSFRTTAIEFKGGTGLPARMVVPDHLTEVLMNLLQAYVELDTAERTAGHRILVETLQQGVNVIIRLTCDAAAGESLLNSTSSDPRMASTMRRVQTMGGRLTAVAKSLEIALPATG
jgi:His Kinase A (phospho-acceptor) domain